MKHLGSLMAVIGLLFSMHAYNTQHHTSVQAELDPLIQSVSIMNEVGAHLEKWRVQAKDSQSFISDRSGYQAYVNRIHSLADGFAWTVPVDEGSRMVIKGTKSSSFAHIDETITLLTHITNGKYETKMTYEMSSSHWQAHRINDIFSHFLTQSSELFLKTPAFFTCATGKFSDKMEVVLSEKARNIMRLLRANYVESLEEESFVSLSAYAKRWDASIATNHKKMNLQIALRDEGLNKPTRVLIGTPILTAEY